MSTPPFLIAAALALWGWRTGFWIFAGVMAVLFELSRFVKWRWDFSDKEYARVLDVCTLLFIGAMLYLRFNVDISRSGFLLFQWTPVVFGLMMLVQAYGAREKIPFYVFSWFARIRRRKEKPTGGEKGLNIAWPYFSICLLASGATNVAERDFSFYLAVIALCGFGTWFTRVRRYSAKVWAGCFLGAALLGLVGLLGWTGLQQAVTPMFGQLFARFSAKDFDATYARTTMGQVGAQKKSGAIVLRLKPVVGRVPGLLRQASYDVYKSGTWNASLRDYATIQPENDLTTWPIVESTNTSSTVQISSYLSRKQALLFLPHGVNRIRELPVVEMGMSGMGTTRVKEAPGLASYRADFSPRTVRDEAYGGNDLFVPPIEEPVISEIAAEVQSKARGTNQLDLVQALENFFSANFTYSLYHKENAQKDGTALGRFLKTTRTGHCEYFASATTLLLRELRIPARYVVGYSVQESKGDVFVVRQRHAHAWALAWLNGGWHEIDTTPGTWLQMENETASKLEKLKDFLSDLWFKFSSWRWLGQKGFISRAAPFLILPLSGILVWRIFFKKKRSQMKETGAAKFNWPGLDSEYYELEARLAAAGHERHPHETPRQWLERLKRDGVRHPSLPALVELHYRYRFDPRGLEASDRKVLKELAGTRVEVGDSGK
jgi:protein-glutamine gamma-glutamyltransferase